MARSPVDLGIIPYYGDYTTVWYRIHDMQPSLDISRLETYPSARMVLVSGQTTPDLTGQRSTGILIPLKESIWLS